MMISKSWSRRAKTKTILEAQVQKISALVLVPTCSRSKVKQMRWLKQLRVRLVSLLQPHSSLSIHQKKNKCSRRESFLKDQMKTCGLRASSSRWFNPSKLSASTRTRFQRSPIYLTWWIPRSICVKVRHIWKMLLKLNSCLVRFWSHPRKIRKRLRCSEIKCRLFTSNRLKPIWPSSEAKMTKDQIRSKVPFWAAMTDRTWRYSSRSFTQKLPFLSWCALNRCAFGPRSTTNSNHWWGWPNSAEGSSYQAFLLEIRSSWQRMSIPRWSRFYHSCSSSAFNVWKTICNIIVKL